MITLEKTREISLAPKFLYTSEEIKNISGLGDVLREIRARLLKEGVSIEKKRRKLSLDISKGRMLKYKPYAKKGKRKTI